MVYKVDRAIPSKVVLLDVVKFVETCLAFFLCE